jgi:uncharacterized protein DUF5658
MTLTTSLLVAAALTTGSAGDSIRKAPPAEPTGIRAAMEVSADDRATSLATVSIPKAPAGWVTPAEQRRPAALPAMYASLAALQVLDVYSTRRAIGAGAREANPAMRSAAGSGSGAMLAVKAVSSATSIFFTERAWKKNRKGAVILLAAINGVTAAIVANNVRNAR